MDKRLSTLILCLFIFVVVVIITWLGIQLDLAINGAWLRATASNISWINYFTTGHGPVLAYLNGNILWLTPAMLFAGIAGLYCISNK